MFSLLNTLSESRLFPSTKSLSKLDTRDAADLTHVHICALRILLHEPDSKDWAERFAKRTSDAPKFNRWRADATDLYALLHALTAKDSPLDDTDRELRDDLPINRNLIREWLRRESHGMEMEGATRQLFGRLDAMFRIRDQTVRAMRRLVQDWPELTKRERKLVITKMLQILRVRARNGEMLPKIEALAKRDKLELQDVCNSEEGDNCGPPSEYASKHAAPPPHRRKRFGTLASLAALGAGAYLANRSRAKLEQASVGATSSGNVAAVQGALGAGFDTDYSKSVYPPPKTAKKPVVLRRAPLKEDTLTETAITFDDGRRVIVMRNPPPERVVVACRNAFDGHLRGLLIGPDAYWWAADDRIHGDIAKALGHEDYVQDRLHMIEMDGEVRFDYDDQAWPFHRLIEHPYMRRMLNCPDIYLYMGGYGYIPATEWVQEWQTA